MANLSTTIKLNDGVSAPVDKMVKSMDKLINRFRSLEKATGESLKINGFAEMQNRLSAISTQVVDVTKSLEALSRTKVKIEVELDDSALQAGRISPDAAADSGNDSSKGSPKLGLANLGGVAAKVASIVFSPENLKAGMDMTDAFNRQGVELQGVVAAGESVLDLQKRIYYTASQSGAAYDDVASSLIAMSNNNPNLFKDSGESLQFIDLLNKSMETSGMNAEDMGKSMGNITDILSKGKISGDALSYILENVPAAQEAIQNFKGLDDAGMQNLIKSGTLSADEFARAMLGASDQINAAYGKMPGYFSNIWQEIKDAGLIAMSGLMTRIGEFLGSDNVKSVIDGIINVILGLGQVMSWVGIMALDIFSIFVAGWSIFEPIILGVAAAMAVFNAKLIVSNALMLINNIRTAIQQGLTATLTTLTGIFNQVMDANPLVRILMIVIGVVSAFYAFIAAINQVMGTSISATGVIMGAFATVGAFLMNLVFSIIEFWAGCFFFIINYFINFAEFFANFLNDPVGSIIRLFAGLADNVLMFISAIASGIDKLFGTSLAANVEGLRGNLEQMKVSVAGEAQTPLKKLDTKDLGLKRMNYADSYNSGYKFGENLESKLGESAKSKFDLKSQMGGAVNNPTSTANAGFDVSKYNNFNTTGMPAIDAAKYTNNMPTTASPISPTVQGAKNNEAKKEVKIHLEVNNTISKDIDVDEMIKKLTDALREGMANSGEGVYA